MSRETPIVVGWWLWRHGQENVYSRDDSPALLTFKHAVGAGLLRAVRNARGETQRHVADVVGCHISMVKHWEAGRSLPVRFHRQLERYILGDLYVNPGQVDGAATSAGGQQEGEHGS